MSAPCQFAGCRSNSLWRYAGINVCARHQDALEKTLMRERSDLDHPPLKRFRFVRRRGGYETWLSYGAGSTNLVAHGIIPLLRLSAARDAARVYAAAHGFEFVDEERVIDREVLRALFGKVTAR